MLSSFGRVTHRSILRCVGLALLSYVKAQHGQVWSSTGTAKFGQALVLRSVSVHGTGNARRGVGEAKQGEARRRQGRAEFRWAMLCSVRCW